jgi:MoaA/NifB/PqqE/SkfB family radical SAM enzyme
MPRDIYVEIIQEIAHENPKARVWEIFFGEPTLFSEMAERIEYAKNWGLMDVVLNSNGVLLTKETAIKYINAGLDWIYVGIDAVTEDTYQKMRVGGDFKKVVENVLFWRETKNNIYAQFVECDLNRHEKDAFIQFWNQYDIPVKIRPMVSWMGLIDNKAVIKQSTELCYWLKNSISILNTGEVALCACDINGRYIQGDIKKTSIKSIWESYHKQAPDACNKCGDWQFANSIYVGGQKCII